MLKVYVYRNYELGTVEEASDSDFNSGRVFLYLKDLNFIRPGFLVVGQNIYDIITIFLLANKKEFFFVLGFSTGFYDISSRSSLDEFYCFIEIRKIPT